jgi:hypothetical protein
MMDVVIGGWSCEGMDTNTVIGNKKDEQEMHKGLGHHGINWVG